MGFTTNIQEPPVKASVVWAIARWILVGIIIYGVMGAIGGLFDSGPKHIPIGMTWENPDAASSSTFYVLQGGQHLILELNAHSQRWMAMLFAGLAVMVMYIASQGFQGKLKNKQKQSLPGWGQMTMALLMSAMAVLIVSFGLWTLTAKETLDLDPAADTVTLNGHQICTFRQARGFRFYTTRGSKGSIHYHLVLERAGGSDVQIGGPNAHSDVQMMAAYLNGYLNEARR